MFTLFTVRHIGGPRGPPTWRLHTKLYNFAQNISTNISTLGQHTCLKRGELPSLASTILKFLDFIHCMVFDFNFYCVTMHTLFPYLILFSFIIKFHFVSLLLLFDFYYFSFLSRFRGVPRRFRVVPGRFRVGSSFYKHPFAASLQCKFDVSKY